MFLCRRRRTEDECIPAFAVRPSLFVTRIVRKAMLDSAIDLARRAGALLLAGFESRRAVQLKSPFELVTDADHASEELIVSAISQQFPDHAVIAEERGGAARESA